MGIKSYVEESICREEDENGEYKKSVPVFKKGFSKDVKELWDLIENGDDDIYLRELYDKANDVIGWLKFLRNDLNDYSDYSEEKEDFI